MQTEGSNCLAVIGLKDVGDLLGSQGYKVDQLPQGTHHDLELPGPAPLQVVEPSLVSSPAVGAGFLPWVLGVDETKDVAFLGRFGSPLGSMETEKRSGGTLGEDRLHGGLQKEEGQQRGLRVGRSLVDPLKGSRLG